MNAIYSCDDHLDLSAVAPDLWQSRLPSALAERAPRVVVDDGRSVWMCEDRVIGRSGNAGVSAAASRRYPALPKVTVPAKERT